MLNWTFLVYVDVATINSTHIFNIKSLVINIMVARINVNSSCKFFVVWSLDLVWWSWKNIRYFKILQIYCIVMLMTMLLAALLYAYYTCHTTPSQFYVCYVIHTISISSAGFGLTRKLKSKKKHIKYVINVAYIDYVWTKNNKNILYA